MAGGVLNTFGKFSVPAFTPVWLNISFIVAALFFADYFSQPIFVLAWAVFFGGILQLSFQIPFLKKIGCLPSLDFNFNDPGVWRVVKLMGPSILGVSVAQISLLINTVFASFLAVGSVSWLYYADRLIEFPAGVLGVALSTVLLPSLSRSLANNKKSEYSSLINWGIKLGILTAAPASAALVILSIPLITTLFFYGGLIGLIQIKIIAPAFYAQQNVKTPVKIAIFTLFCTQFMNLIFIGIFQHAGLALAIGLGACINAGLLFFFLQKSNLFKLDPNIFKFITKVLVSASVMSAVLFYFKGSTEDWLNYSAASRVGNLLFLIFVGMVVYFLSLKCCGIKLTKFLKKNHNY